MGLLCQRKGPPTQDGEQRGAGFPLESLCNHVRSHMHVCATCVHKEGRKDTQWLTWPSPERQMGMRLELYILVLRFELLHNAHSARS